MLEPLKGALERDPEMAKYAELASKYVSGVHPAEMSRASAEYNDLLQAAFTHFKPGMPSGGYASAAQKGVKEFLSTAAPKGSKSVAITPQIEEAIGRPGGAEGSSGLMDKVKQIYDMASPRLKAYMDNILDPSKPRPNVSRTTLQNELAKLREQVGEARTVKPATTAAGKGVVASQEAPPSTPALIGESSAAWQQQLPYKGSLPPREPNLPLRNAQAETATPEGSFDPRNLQTLPREPEVPIRSEFGSMDPVKEQISLYPELKTAYERLFPEVRPKPRRSLKQEVAPE